MTMWQTMLNFAKTFFNICRKMYLFFCDERWQWIFLCKIHQVWWPCWKYGLLWSLNPKGWKGLDQKTWWCELFSDKECIFMCILPLWWDPLKAYMYLHEKSAQKYISTLNNLYKYGDNAWKIKMHIIQFRGKLEFFQLIVPFCNIFITKLVHTYYKVNADQLRGGGANFGDISARRGV